MILFDEGKTHYQNIYNYHGCELFPLCTSMRLLYYVICLVFHVRESDILLIIYHHVLF